MKGFFVTGTDTGVGKTWCATGLLAALQAQGLSTIAMKPVAAGCESTAPGLCNEDALLLMQAMTESASYDEINPYAFAPAMAPHLAAHAADVEIDIASLQQQAKVLSARADRIVVEGAGGWLVPLSLTTTMADLAVTLNLPVILVVGIRLGCINHALLTADSIRTSGLPLAGWIANTGLPDVDSSLDVVANIESLQLRLPAPLLGEVPRLARYDAEQIASYLDLSLI